MSDFYLVERRWLIKADSHDDAQKKTKDWKHFDVHTKHLTEKEKNDIITNLV